MNNDNIDDTAPEEGARIPTDRRPLGFWLRVVDAQLTSRFAGAFAAEGVTRRDWMLLNALSGDVDHPGFTHTHEGKRPGFARKRGGKRLRALADRGWISATDSDSGWELTPDGRAAQERLGEAVSRIRAEVAGAVAPEDFATTMASLEAIARKLGWDESHPHPRGRRGHGRGRLHGWRHGHRFGHRPEFGHRFEPGLEPGHRPEYEPRLKPSFEHNAHHGWRSGHPRPDNA